MKRRFVLVCALCVCAVSNGLGTETNIVARVSTTNTIANVDGIQPINDGRCEATTKSGNRCKRKAVRGERYCRQHLKIRKETLHECEGDKRNRPRR